MIWIPILDKWPSLTCCILCGCGFHVGSQPTVTQYLKLRFSTSITTFFFLKKKGKKRKTLSNYIFKIGRHVLFKLKLPWFESMAEKLTMILIFQIMFEFILLIGFLVCLALLIRWISFVNTYLRQINRLKKKNIWFCCYISPFRKYKPGLSSCGGVCRKAKEVNITL